MIPTRITGLVRIFRGCVLDREPSYCRLPGSSGQYAADQISPVKIADC